MLEYIYSTPILRVGIEWHSNALTANKPTSSPFPAQWTITFFSQKEGPLGVIPSGATWLGGGTVTEEVSSPNNGKGAASLGVHPKPDHETSSYTTCESVTGKEKVAGQAIPLQASCNRSLGG